MFHYWADGDWAENGIAPERIGGSTPGMRQRCSPGLANSPTSRCPLPASPGSGWSAAAGISPCCSSPWPGTGDASRARVGFTGYLIDGRLIDHEIAEVWDGSAERWRLVEPEIDDDHTDPADGASFDALDVPPDRFLTAPRAWQLARSGAIDPERFITAPGLEIWPWLRHNLVHDLAALNKTEMLFWEVWGVDTRTPPGPGELPVLDELATLTAQPSPPLADLRSAYRRPEFVVPDTVTSYSPARTDVPAVIDVSAVARAAS